MRDSYVSIKLKVPLCKFYQNNVLRTSSYSTIKDGVAHRNLGNIFDSQ